MMKEDRLSVLKKNKRERIISREFVEKNLDNLIPYLFPFLKCGKFFIQINKLCTVSQFTL